MNILKSHTVELCEPCPSITGRERIAKQFAGYLSDESRSAAEGIKKIYFPESVEQVVAAVRECRQAGSKITVAGARTGIVGGAVPLEADVVLALEKLNRVKSVRWDEGLKAFITEVEAGVILEDLQEALRVTPPHELPWLDEDSRRAGEDMLGENGRMLFYPVDPTETSAQVGGTVATNASGARTLFYGPTRRWVSGVTVVLANGEVARLRRGECRVKDGRIRLVSEDGEERLLSVPTLDLPKTKHTAGYHLSADDGSVDAVDLFVGSEGTLGLIAEVELELAFEPPERMYVTAFLPDEARAVEFVDAVRNAEDCSQLAMEYTGPKALDLLREKREEEGASSSVPPLPDDAFCSLYVELPFNGDEGFRRCYRLLERNLEVCGVSPADTWAGCSREQLRIMKEFRHAVPEKVNSIIGMRKRDIPSLHKVGTDMAVPDEHLGDVLRLYRERLDGAGLEYIIFGHIGDNHLHVNILPRSEDELELAMDMYGEFADAVVRMGGSVSAEHGIGRIKRDFLKVQFGDEEIAAMQEIKRALDPAGMLNPGVLF